VNIRHTEVRPRERLINAAYDLFSKDGVSQVGINTILAKSDCAKASLYSNFKTKVELAIAFLDKREFEGCSFINVLLESKSGSSVRQAAAIHLAKIRAIVRGLAEEANLQEPEKFAQVWHMLMKGSIVSAGEGNRNAARDAKYAAQIILKGWKRTREADKPRAKRGPGR
jgi:AcrR family transcriptional regulator